jgi:protein involved in polysaccharide export with SLBB domain
MTRAFSVNRSGRIVTSGLLLACVAACCGCHAITYVHDAVPASRLPRDFFHDTKGDRTPFPLTALGQERPASHIVDAGDQLSIYVYGVLPPTTDESPVLQRSQPINQRYYPPHGSVVASTLGLPIEVAGDGTIDLPIVGRLDVSGKTIPEVTDLIKKAYREKQVIQQDAEKVQVALVTPRVHRVVVLREDTPSPQVQLVSPGQVDHIHRGSGEVIDLPVFENDVLHALAATGGLPGTDAAREVWVFKRSGLTDPHAIQPEELQLRTAGFTPGSEESQQVIRIPLTGCPGEELPFRPSDIVLDAGDVVYLPRRDEYFYTGGLLKGAKIPLPRDEDLDVLEAIALATGSVGGPLGQSGIALAGGSPGHMIKPTRVIILRELPDGRQLPIRVDLARAMDDKKERILVQHKDVVMLHFKPHEAVSNGFMNWLSPTLIFQGSGNN